MLICNLSKHLHEHKSFLRMLNFYLDKHVLCDRKLFSCFAIFTLHTSKHSSWFPLKSQNQVPWLFPDKNKLSIHQLHLTTAGLSKIKHHVITALLLILFLNVKSYHNKRPLPNWLIRRYLILLSNYKCNLSLLRQTTVSAPIGIISEAVDDQVETPAMK